MALKEFELIKKYFLKQPTERKDVILGVGDDCALLTPPPLQDLAVTCDTLLSGVHFFSDAAPDDIAYKALAANLSDLAAMGATPAWATLSLTLPDANETWLSQFSKGFFHLLNHYSMQLVGGDTTQGPLSITISAYGFVPKNQALIRSSALAGDEIYVTGELGDAGLALAFLKNQLEVKSAHQKKILQRFNRPLPRIEQGIQLRSIAHAAIDISDGLAADLQHILTSSDKGAEIFVEDLPISSAVRETVSEEEAWRLALTSGDDYELCFTISPENKNKLTAELGKVTCVGRIIEIKELQIKNREGKKIQLDKMGYQHF